MTSPRPTHNALYLQLLADQPVQTASTLPTLLSGTNLSVGQLLLHSRSTAGFELDGRRRTAVEASRQALSTQIASRAVYGVNTSFGANARTIVPDDEVNAVHVALQGLLAGILPAPYADGKFFPSNHDPHALPSAWVRGSILIRINSFLRAHSCVRWDLIERLAALLRSGITPNVPLQGSISASGDLAPLAYVAFALAGHPGLSMSIYEPGPGTYQVTAQEALRRARIEPYSFAPKEVLALINGTAVSAAVAADALGSAHTLLLLAQIVTAVHTEAMLGFRAPFESFLHDVARPHPGQCQVADNLRDWLSDSSMLQDREQSAGIEYPGPVSMIISAISATRCDPESKSCQSEAAHFLKQDRYAIRTAPQWLGPVLEDFVAAHETITTELNSSTDNPLFDPLSEQLYHGGNFQAAAVTNAVEKIRDGLSTIGRLIFAQQSELLNPQRSNGLPTCLAPSLGPNKDGGLKGLDIANASYLSELNFLANRVNHFVQCAEMDNQCVNSLALISARFTVQAAEVLKKLMANAVYGVLQAIDLRMGMCRLVVHLFETSCLYCAGWSTFTSQKKAMLIHTIIFELMQTSHLDIQERSEIAARAFCHAARKEGIDLSLSFRPDLYPNHTEPPLEPEEEAEKRLAELLDSCYVGCHVLDARPHNPSIRADRGEDNHSFLSSSMTGALWSFVREDLGVGSYTGLAEYSWAFAAGPRDGRFEASYRGQPPGGGKTIGAEVSKIFDAFQNGKFDAFLRELLQRERPGAETDDSEGSETGDGRTAEEIMASLGIY